MTGVLFQKYLQRLDRSVNRPILLLIDNAPTHALYETTHLTNITIEHLPPNTTAHLSRDY